jgi:hypothetical protein
VSRVRTPAQRGALGSLFLILAACVAGVAWAAADANQWLISTPAVVIALWLAGLSVRAFRAR